MKPKIKFLDLFYGNKCQIACEQCDTRSDLLRKGEYDPSIENIIEGFDLARKHFDIEILSLLGGEPLLYLDKIEELLKYIRSVDSSTTLMIPSNGELIARHLERLSVIIPKYKVLFVTYNHFEKFKDKTKSNILLESVNALAESIKVPITNSNRFYSEIMNQNPSDPGWIEYWKNKKEYGFETDYLLDFSDTTNKLWWNGSYGLFLEDKDDHNKHFYLKNNKPKPFNSDNIDKSYYINCPSCFCTFMYNKKLYKCAALGTLKQFLERHECIEDHDWQKYLSYKPLDLETCTKDEAEQFSVSKYKPINECSMCPENTHKVILTEETVLPLKFFKHKPS